MSQISVVYPAKCDEKAFQIAADIFCRLWRQVTGDAPAVVPDNSKLPSGDIAFIGTENVNRQVHSLYMKGAVPDFGLKCTSDDYAIISHGDEKRNQLFIAGGCGRSTIYAVYDFFRRQAGVEYFWDGDVIPKQAEIDISNCDYVESPRFEYRGLRYFAHRGLHRFQAEHWSLEDWQKEIDWLLKKRLNLFMLRIGIDDLFQRAFPEIVPYPPSDQRDPDFVDRSYDDRTSFWPLEYRGELRKKVLQYAFERGLLHPEDTGTMTHWYSRTPASFIENRPVSFMEQAEGFYNQKTGMVWDIEKEQSWQDYWKLTQTHIEQFGQGRLFHTIGLAERSFGRTREENLRIKKSVYRKIQQLLRYSYPDAPLLIASWDFAAFWQDDEVKELLKEFNPDNTLILDYAADMDGKTSFQDWGFCRKFPWLFGIFHAFEPETGIHGKYGKLTEKIRQAAGDRFCKGMVLWPEASHIDTLMLEFFAAAAWQPASIDLEKVIASLCEKRYYGDSILMERMVGVWTKVAEVVADEGWNADFMYWDKSFQFEPHFRLLDGEMFTGDLRSKHEFLRSAYDKLSKANTAAGTIIEQLIALAETGCANAFWRRDAVDMTRTLLSLKIRENVLSLLLILLEKPQDTAGLEACGETLARQFKLLPELLQQHDDFSLQASLLKLQKNRQINPYSEQTLKSNCENSYSRSQIYELAAQVYPQEFAVFFEGVKACAQDRETELPQEVFKKRHLDIQDCFYSTPLDEMQSTVPQNSHTLSTVMADILQSFS